MNKNSLFLLVFAVLIVPFMSSGTPPSPPRVELPSDSDSDHNSLSVVTGASQLAHDASDDINPSEARKSIERRRAAFAPSPETEEGWSENEESNASHQVSTQVSQEAERPAPASEDSPVNAPANNADDSPPIIPSSPPPSPVAGQKAIPAQASRATGATGTGANFPAKPPRAPQFSWTSKNSVTSVKEAPSVPVNASPAGTDLPSALSTTALPLIPDKLPPPPPHPKCLLEDTSTLPSSVSSGNGSSANSNFSEPPMSPQHPAPAAPEQPVLVDLTVQAHAPTEDQRDLDAASGHSSSSIPSTDEILSDVEIPTFDKSLLNDLNLSRSSEPPAVPPMDSNSSTDDDLPPAPEAPLGLNDLPPALVFEEQGIPLLDDLPLPSDIPEKQLSKTLQLLIPYLQSPAYVVSGFAVLGLAAEIMRWSLLTAPRNDMQIIQRMIGLAKDNQLDAESFDKLTKKLTVVPSDTIEKLHDLMQNDRYAAIGFMHGKVLEDLQKQHDAQGIFSRLKRGANIRANQLRSLGKSAADQGQNLVAKTRALLFAKKPV